MHARIALNALGALIVLGATLNTGTLSGAPVSHSPAALSTAPVDLAAFVARPVTSDCSHCKGSDWCHHCGGTGAAGGPKTTCSGCHGTGSCQHCLDPEPVQIMPKPYLVRD